MEENKTCERDRRLHGQRIDSIGNDHASPTNHSQPGGADVAQTAAHSNILPSARVSCGGHSLGHCGSSLLPGEALDEVWLGRSRPVGAKAALQSGRT